MVRATVWIVVIISVGGALSLLPYALGDDSKSPIQAVWDAIYDLQNRDDSLQTQIDDLRASREILPEVDALLSELSVEVEVENDGTFGETIFLMKVVNGGNDRAAGTKVTAFYKMPLFHINSIDYEDCRNLERGIIQCDLGTIAPGEERSITIDATATESGEHTSLTVDVSSTTEDAIPTNNHMVVDFETWSILHDEDGPRKDASEITNSTDTQASQSNNNEESEAGDQDDDNKSEAVGGNQTSSESSPSNDSGEEDEKQGGESQDDDSQNQSAGSNQTSSDHGMPP